MSTGLFCAALACAMLAAMCRYVVWHGRREFRLFVVSAVEPLNVENFTPFIMAVEGWNVLAFLLLAAAVLLTVIGFGCCV